MHRYNRIMEIFWLVTAVITALAAGMIVFKRGLKGNLMLLAIPLLAGAMYALRRGFRKKADKTNNDTSKTEAGKQ